MNYILINVLNDIIPILVVIASVLPIVLTIVAPPFVIAMSFGGSILITAYIVAWYCNKLHNARQVHLIILPTSDISMQLVD
jgi:hypothetical protein